MQEIFEFYRRVAGGFPYMGLFFLSLIFSYVVFRKKRELWVYPNLLVLLLLFNPFIKGILNRYFLEGDVSWRMWWIIPIPFLISVMFTKTLDFVKGKERVFLSIIICLTIVVSGRFVFNSNNFTWAQNSFHLPHDIIEISRIIMDDSLEQGIVEHNVVAVTDVAWRLRMYNPEIQMLYGRHPTSFVGVHSVEIHQIINSEQPDFERADSLFREDGVLYIVLNRQNLYALPEYFVHPDELGYEMLGFTENYKIYRTDF